MKKGRTEEGRKGRREEGKKRRREEGKKGRREEGKKGRSISLIASSPLRHQGQRCITAWPSQRAQQAQSDMA